MQLHLVVPGLIWPASLLRDNSQDLVLPALSCLLGRGRLEWRAPQSPEDALCTACGINLPLATDTSPGSSALPASPTSPLPAPHASPLAALRYLGSGGSPGDDYWLCADPVHLSLQRSRLLLDRHASAASTTELELIAAAINALLQQQTDADFLHAAHFVTDTLGQGYLRLPATAPASAHQAWQRLATHNPSMAAGHDDLLPLGSSPQARRWRQFSNEAQMCLHQLPCHQARLDARQAPLNALWLWGAGRLPQLQPQPPLTFLQAVSPHAGNSALLAGLARLQGQAVEHIQTLAQRLPLKHDSICLLDALQPAWQDWDALGWREALLALERDWLQPLLAAWQNGRIERLLLSAPGAQASLRLELHPLDRLCFWRKPRTLASLAHALPASVTTAS